MHRHDFDPDSGWCKCGLRDDGRLISKRGVVYQHGHPDLDAERARLEEAPA